MRKRFQNIGKPCPGPQEDDEQSCPYQVVVENRGALAIRCRDCSYRRQTMRAVRSQRSKRTAQRRANAAKMRMLTGVKKAGAWKPLQPNLGPPRVPVTRCKVCLGMPHARDPERRDEYGNTVCLPGMARCRLCWEAYAPLPELHAQAILGSSAAMAARVALW